MTSIKIGPIDKLRKTSSCEGMGENLVWSKLLTTSVPNLRDKKKKRGYTFSPFKETTLWV